jgi:hypothetical protein
MDERMGTPDRTAQIAECRRRSCGRKWIPTGFAALSTIALAAAQEIRKTRSGGNLIKLTITEIPSEPIDDGQICSQRIFFEGALRQPIRIVAALTLSWLAPFK